jgi:hypothetical protein
MSQSDRIIKDLVIANWILAHLGVFDVEGSISVRDPQDAERYLLACGRSPALVGVGDVVQFTHDGAPAQARARPFQRERFNHGAV